MKRIFNLLVLLMTVILLIPLASEASRGIKSGYLSPSGKIVAGDNWLFIVGINDYVKWPQLTTAVNDAKSLKSVLLGRYCFESKKVVELYDRKATRTNIIGKLRYLAKNLKKDDSLVVFYAGHGHIDSITKEGSWIPVESDISNSAAWVSNHDIKKYLSINAIKAKHVLLISDSCFSGDFFRGKRSSLSEITSAVVKKAYRLVSRQAITSGGLEPVSDAGFGNNSVFSYFLIKTLKENSDPFLIPSSLFPDVKAGVAENAEQFPQFGSLKGTGGQQGGEFVFFLKQDTMLKDLSGSAEAKSKELIYLQKLEKEKRLSKKREQTEIAKRNKELAVMDAKIVAMKKRIGTTPGQSDDPLSNMLTMVRKKEEQEKKLEELKRQKARETAKRQDEINKIKRAESEKELTALKKDISDYNKIIGSKFGIDMADAAWKSLVAKYPQRAKGVFKGDVDSLIGPGWLQLKTKPENAEIRLVNSNTLCKKAQSLKVGNYIVKVSAQGYISKTVKIKIKGGETTTVSVGLYRGIQNSIGMKFIYIKPGSFNMGSNRGSSPEKPVHRVTLSKGFYMQTTEVIQGQWQSVMENKPPCFSNCAHNCPINCVTWNDTKAFILRLNNKEGVNKYRLPTEAEWEYACRAGSETKYANDNVLDVMGWYSVNSGKTPHSVAGKKSNAWGLYDMHGNLYEWCENWLGNYSSGNVTDPVGPSTGTYRVIRGGSWYADASSCESANRRGDAPGNCSAYLGFRIVRDL